MKGQNVSTITCRNCEQAINLASVPTKGQIITCYHCNTHYEVVSLEPLELFWLYREAKADEEMKDLWFAEPYPLLGEGWWSL